MKKWSVGAFIGVVLGLTAPAVAEEPAYSAEYQACMDQSGGATFAMIDCMTAEHDRQDALLNKTYKSVMATLSKERKDQLRAAQRLWISFREANCAFHDDPEGGTMARVSATSCHLSATAERAREPGFFLE